MPAGGVIDCKGKTYAEALAPAFSDRPIKQQFGKRGAVADFVRGQVAGFAPFQLVPAGKQYNQMRPRLGLSYTHPNRRDEKLQ